MDAPGFNNLTTAHAAFRTTHWSVVMAVGSDSSEEAGHALEVLCRAYWRPLYAFVRRNGHGVEEAQDLTQAFFARLLERRDLEMVRQHKGRFRSFLLASLKNFLVNDWHRARAVKRGGGREIVSLDELLDEERVCLQLADETTADKLFERRWALRLLETVLAKLELEFRGDAQVFQSWKRTLNDDRPAALASLASELGTNENALKQAFHRLRGRYRQLLREEVAHTVAQPGEVDDELTCLIRILRT